LIAAPAGLRVWVATHPVDFRRGINGLVALVAQTLEADPYGGEIFVFRSKRADRIKLLAWDGSGIILATNHVASYCISCCSK
jgi:transposase